MGVLAKVIKNQSTAKTGVGAMAQTLNKVISEQQLIPAIGFESMMSDTMAETHVLELTDAAAGLRAAVESLVVEHGIGNPSPAQVESAVGAGIISGDPESFFGQSVPKITSATESMTPVNLPLSDGFDKYTISVESYDTRENRNATTYSILYNLNAARQNEFGETFFPTIAVGPDEAGLAVHIRNMMVYNGILRSVKGAAAKFNKKPLIRAFADATILRDDTTQAVPVYRQGQNDDKFADTNVVAPRAIEVAGTSVQTAPLAFGKEVDLIGISQTDELLASGAMDQSDALDPTLNLKTVYVAFTGTDANNNAVTDVVSINVGSLPKSNFTYSTQGQTREMTLAFDTNSVVLDGTTKRVDGSPLSALAALAAQGLSVRIRMVISGNANIEYGNVAVYGNSMSVELIRNSNGEVVPLSDTSVADLVAAINGGAFVGYELDAWRTNSNIRQRGQLIDSNEYVYLYNVPVRSPISVVRPVNADKSQDASDLAALITATRIRTSNAAVSTLLETATTLAQYNSVADEVGEAPESLGVGRFLVRPVYFEDNLDMGTVVDSLSSSGRITDIQGALINAVRDYAYRMYSLSEYKAAIEAMTGGVGVTPTVIVGTDPVIARYLTATDTFRNIGGNFDVRVVSTLDKRVRGKVFISFGIFDGNENKAPNPLTFGNMGWAPEVTVSLPVSRNGQASRELIVQPRFLHVANLPVLTVLNVTNIPEVANGKVAVYNHTI